MSAQTYCIISKRHHRGVGVCCTRCPGYLHASCSGLTTGKDYYQGFSCKKCAAENQAPEAQTAVPNDLSDPYFWASPTDDKIRKLLEVYNEVVQWKPVFFSFSAKIRQDRNSSTSSTNSCNLWRMEQAGVVSL